MKSPVTYYLNLIMLMIFVMLNVAIKSVWLLLITIVLFVLLIIFDTRRIVFKKDCIEVKFLIKGKTEIIKVEEIEKIEFKSLDDREPPSIIIHLKDDIKKPFFYKLIKSRRNSFYLALFYSFKQYYKFIKENTIYFDKVVLNISRDGDRQLKKIREYENNL